MLVALFFVLIATGVLTSATTRRLRSTETEAERESHQPEGREERLRQDPSQRRRRLYNAFKSYADSPPSKRPPQYSREMDRKHDIEEFLSPGQKKAMILRNTKNNDFEGVYKGHEVFQKLKKAGRAAKSKPRPKMGPQPSTDGGNKKAAPMK